MNYARMLKIQCAFALLAAAVCWGQEPEPEINLWPGPASLGAARVNIFAVSYSFENLPSPVSSVVEGVTYEYAMGDMIRSVSDVGTSQYSRLWIRGATPVWYPLWSGDITRVTEGFRIRVEREEPNTYRVHWIPGEEDGGGSKAGGSRYLVDKGTTDYVQHFLGRYPFVSVKEEVSNEAAWISVTAPEEDTLAFTTLGDFVDDFFVVQITRAREWVDVPAQVNHSFILNHGADAIVWSCWDKIDNRLVWPAVNYYGPTAIFQFASPPTAGRYRINYEAAASAYIGQATSREFRLHHMADSTMFDHGHLGLAEDGMFQAGQFELVQTEFPDYDYADFVFEVTPTSRTKNAWWYTPRYVGYDQYNELFERLDGANRALMSGLHGNPSTHYTLGSATATVIAASETFYIPTDDTYASGDVPNGMAEAWYDETTGELHVWDGTDEYSFSGTIVP